MKILDWILALIASLLLLQTLYFKFSGSAESIYIFETVGIEPWGRYASGVAELVAGILLLIPRLRLYGALIAAGVISGALFFHLTSLGIVVMDDGGQLFIYALLVFLSSLGLIFIHRKEIPFISIP